jgi:fatty-acid peroxygenase
MASPIPRERTLDSSVNLLREGYEFIGNRCRRYDTDLFETRLLLQPAVCMQGEEAARVFYEPDRFTRKRALPLPILTLLQDLGSVQVLDGEAHRHRKRMFMDLMEPQALQRLAELTAAEWDAAIGRWERAGEVVLLDESHEILCRAVCRWAGVPLDEHEVAQRTADFAAMIDGAGAVGPRNVRAHVARRRAEAWMQDIVERVRAGRLDVPPDAAAHVIAHHRGVDGQLLDPEIATVELINVLRPTVAVGRFVTFSALARHDHPDGRETALGDDDDLTAFVQEVRRFYPFFPAVAGRVAREFVWRGHHFTKGLWVLLDLYGTDHDGRIWDRPEEFRPQRFGSYDASAFSFIPQGGGDHHTGHRCAGEWLTIELMKVSLRALTGAMVYRVPDQDLGIRLSRMPAFPNSGFVIDDVRRTS